MIFFVKNAFLWYNKFYGIINIFIKEQQMPLPDTLKSYQESNQESNPESNSHQILEQHTRNVVELLGLDFSSLQTTESETAPLLSAHQQEKDFDENLQGHAGPSCDKISDNTNPPTDEEREFIEAILDRFKAHNPDFKKGFEGYSIEVRIIDNDQYLNIDGYSATDCTKKQIVIGLGKDLLHGNKLIISDKAIQANPSFFNETKKDQTIPDISIADACAFTLGHELGHCFEQIHRPKALYEYIQNGEKKDPILDREDNCYAIRQVEALCDIAGAKWAHNAGYNVKPYAKLMGMLNMNHKHPKASERKHFMETIAETSSDYCQKQAKLKLHNNTK